MKLLLFTLASFLVGCNASLERMSNYVEQEQIFFVESSSLTDMEDAYFLVEDKAALSLFTWITWICKPKVTTHGNVEHFDSLGAQAISFIKPLDKSGNFFEEPRSYISAWTREGKYFETLIDDSDQFVIQFLDHPTPAFSYYTGSKISGGSEHHNGGESLGFASTGEGEWINDTTDPRLIALSEEIGIPLTAEMCHEHYNKVWDKKHLSENQPTSDANEFNKSKGWIAGVALGLLASLAVTGILIANNREKIEPTLEDSYPTHNPAEIA